MSDSYKEYCNEEQEPSTFLDKVRNTINRVKMMREQERLHNKLKPFEDQVREATLFTKSVINKKAKRGVAQMTIVPPNKGQLPKVLYLDMLDQVATALSEEGLSVTTKQNGIRALYVEVPLKG